MPLQLSQGLYEFLLLWNGESNYNDLFVLKVTFCSCFFPKLSNFSPNLGVTQRSVSMCPMSGNFFFAVKCCHNVYPLRGGPLYGSPASCPWSLNLLCHLLCVSRHLCCLHTALPSWIRWRHSRSSANIAVYNPRKIRLRMRIVLDLR